MKLFFLKSPTGEHGLAYSAGQAGDVKDKDMAELLIEQGYAITETERKRREAADAKAAAADEAKADTDK